MPQSPRAARCRWRSARRGDDGDDDRAEAGEREERRAARARPARLTSRDTPFASTRISPTFSRVTNVEDMPARFALEELDQVEVRADRDDQLRALLVREQQREVLADPGRRDGLVRRRRAARSRSAPGASPSRYAWTSSSAPAAQRRVGDRVHVADDHVGLRARPRAARRRRRRRRSAPA